MGFKRFISKIFGIPLKKKTSISSNSDLTSEEIEFLKKPIQRPDTGFCHYCKRKAGGIDNYKCRYCGYHFCSDCRLPESHNCERNSFERYDHGVAQTTLKKFKK